MDDEPKTEWHSLVAGVISWNGYYGDSWERVTSSNCRQEPGSVCVCLGMSSGGSCGCVDACGFSGTEGF